MGTYINCDRRFLGGLSYTHHHFCYYAFFKHTFFQFLRFSFEVRENSKSSSLPFELLFDLTCEFEPEKAVALIRHHGDSSVRTKYRVYHKNASTGRR